MNIPVYGSLNSIPTSYVGAMIQVGDEIYTWSGSQYTPPGVSAAPGSLSNPFASTTERDTWASEHPGELVVGLEKRMGAAEVIWKGPNPDDWEYKNPVRKGAQKAGVLGDSISYMYSSCPVQAATAFGDVVVLNAAVGGAKIEDQAAQIPAILAAGATKVYVQVGTNNLVDDETLLYSKYLALYNALRIAGLDVVVSFISPLTYALCNRMYKLNNCAYYAAIKCGCEIYSPWEQFALANGGWSIATIGSDSKHPVESGQATAAGVLVSQMQTRKTCHPVVRAQPDSMVVGACFVNDGNADGVADGWTGSASAGGSFSLEADGANGHKWQVCTLTDPGVGGFAKVYQDTTTGFAVGDTLVARGNLNMEVPDGTDSKVYLAQEIKFLDGSNATLSSVFANNFLKQATGDSTFENTFTVPTGTVKIRMEIGWYAWTSATGTCTLKVSRVGMLNLTALGIDP